MTVLSIQVSSRYDQGVRIDDWSVRYTQDLPACILSPVASINHPSSWLVVL